MVTVLDRSRPYGEVWGAPGIAFVQDAQLFDHLGRAAIRKPSPAWERILNDPKLAQHELTANAAANTVRELSNLPHSEVKRIARDEYMLHTGRMSKDELIHKIHQRIMEQA
ncbi:MAG: hypothetical protein HQL84_10005 [Magnetococcales bacterium]|nr:hypothetical protein [Magnetococcales bacterium]MBF0150364.1 hypothetical protein [Magnetococcales bacterium]MBF0632158.1 hypothetical protein [Magnetococcales bacterium]